MASSRSPFLLQSNPVYDDGNDFMSSTLNTPDIVEMLDAFHPPLQAGGTEKDLANSGPMLSDMSSSMYGLLDGSQPGPMMNGSTGNSGGLNYDYLNMPSPTSQHGCTANNNYYERKSYSPMLESAEINLENMNSPEMAPVSPNKVCPQSEYSYQFDGSGNGAYQILESALPIKSEYDQMSSLIDYLNDRPQTADNLITFKSAPSIGSTGSSFYHHSSPHSPASISSGYSIDSANSQQQQQQQQKTFAILDNVPGIKQEPIDSIQIQYPSSSVVPTVVDETIISATSYLPSGGVATNQPVIYNLNPATNVQPNSYYYLASTDSNTTSNSSNASTRTNMVATQHQPGPSSNSCGGSQQPQSTSGMVVGRKRTAAGYGISGQVPGGTGTKKQRMSKREKQKMMEAQIERYERENKQLAGQIELLDKQINFCKKYLSDNVAPYIQKQQQQQQPIHHQLQSFVGMA